MRVLDEDDFAFEEIPLLEVHGQPVTTIVRRRKALWIEEAKSLPEYVVCGGPEGCGLYMIPACVTGRGWPVFICWKCDRMLVVSVGPKGGPPEKEADAA